MPALGHGRPPCGKPGDAMTREIIDNSLADLRFDFLDGCPREQVEDAPAKDEAAGEEAEALRQYNQVVWNGVFDAENRNQIFFRID